MKPLLLLLILITGCSSAPFTPAPSDSDGGAVDSGRVEGDAAPDDAPAADGRGAGGAPGAGGGMAARRGSGGAGGKPSVGGAPSAGGAPSTGGTPPSGDGCALVTHTNGVGQTWDDCVASGTYNEIQARKACTAWCAGGRCAAPCWSSIVCGVPTVLGEIKSSGIDMLRGWTWDGGGAAVEISVGQSSCVSTGAWD